MRITDKRYARDLRRYNLALRLIALEARTQTICTWTGLSDERIRNLCHSYAKSERAVRHRGPSPNRAGIFLRSIRMRNEGAALGGLFRMLDVAPTEAMSNARRDLPSVARGERLCNAYDLYRRIVIDTSITIEHAVMLAMAISQTGELLLTTCQCGCAILIDRFGSMRRTCIYCQRSEMHKVLPAHITGDSDSESDAGIQQTLL
jgi:hypothetical protein